MEIEKAAAALPASAWPDQARSLADGRILVGSTGRMLAVVIMIVGVALFLRLIQSIFRPNRVRFECPDCGLTRHDIDAVHCKHCGRQLHIRTEGIL